MKTGSVSKHSHGSGSKIITTSGSSGFGSGFENLDDKLAVLENNKMALLISFHLV
jgi:hypothetical protein